MENGRKWLIASTYDSYTPRKWFRDRVADNASLRFQTLLDQVEADMEASPDSYSHIQTPSNRPLTKLEAIATFLARSANGSTPIDR